MTRQRDAITAALEAAGGFRSAQELYADLRRHGSPVGLTTVYRHLAAMTESGAVDVVQTTGGEQLYRRCQTDRHHHHIVCRSCGRSAEVESAAVERWAGRVGSAKGFRDVSHTVEIFGMCSSC